VKEKDSTARDFVKRITDSKALADFEKKVTWLTPSSAHINVRRPYGLWVGMSIFAIGPAMCESENGNAIRHSDVAWRLKQLALDKADNAWGRVKTARKRRELLDAHLLAVKK
jgi:hypothetical protein